MPATGYTTALKVYTDYAVTSEETYDFVLVYGHESDDDADERYSVAKRMANAMSDPEGPSYFTLPETGESVVAFNIRDTNEDEELTRLRAEAAEVTEWMHEVTGGVDVFAEVRRLRELEKRVRQRCKEAVPGWAPELRELLS